MERRELTARASRYGMLAYGALLAEIQRSESPLGQQYLADYAYRQRGYAGSYLGGAGLKTPRALAEHDVAMLRGAEAFGVAPDMADIIAAHAKLDRLPDTMTQHDLVAPCGFVVPPEPVRTVDRHGIPLMIEAMAWRADATMLHIRQYSTRGTMTDAQWAEVRSRSEVLPRMTYMGGYDWDTPMRAQLKHGEIERHGLDVYAAHFWLHAFLLISNQMIASVEHHPPGAITARRARKAQHVPRIRVVVLRRPKNDAQPHEPGSVEFSHRWVVRAHWRRQAFGPGRRERKWVLVPAHVKGPEDKPLVTKTNVFAVAR